MDWSSKHVVVTGGASFIGSHVVDELIARGANDILVVDDLSSGDMANIGDHIHSGKVRLLRGDLLEQTVVREALSEAEVVFHLAAIHGGRGYVDLHQAECAKNLAIDGLLIHEAQRANLEKFVFASSGCIYPTYIQQDTSERLYLDEGAAGPPYDADHMYGWAKLMAEMTLKAYYERYGMRSVSCRFFTVYGERGVENHAVMAMIARAFLKQNPFEVWGDGTQIRNWTYVRDIARGTVLAAERIDDGRAINLGTTERTTVLEAVQETLRYTGHDAEIRLLGDMPTGPMNRVADNRLAHELLGWKPEVSFIDGLHRTIDWYFASKDRQRVSEYLSSMLTERGQQAVEPILSEAAS